MGALTAMVVYQLTVSRAAADLVVSWHTWNTAILEGASARSSPGGGCLVPW